jgi:VCBS repeat-containing protein
MVAKKSKGKKSKNKSSWSLRTLAVVAFIAAAVGLSLTPLISSTLIAQAAGFSYNMALVNADFTGSTLTVTASVDVTKFVGTETSQWVKITWGDGSTTVLQAKTQTNYALTNAGKDFSIHNLVYSHPYTTNGSFSVTLKVYHGNESGNEGSAGESNSVTFQTENTLALCSDNLDNDYDTLIDLLDPDCAAFLNHAPIANDDTYSTNEDTLVAVSAPGVISNDTDFESSALTATLVGTTPNGTLNFNADGSFDYTPNTNWSGTDSFTYTVSDGALTSNTATAYIVVSNINDAPVAVADLYTTNEDTLLTVAAAGILANDTDTENDALTAQLESDVNDGTLALAADGSFTYTPDANWSGMDSFTYKAFDGSVLSGTETVVINVTPVNDAPVATASSVTTTQNVAVSDTLVGSDTDSATLTYATTSNPIHGTISAFNSSTGAFTYTPTDPTYTGTDSFDFTVTDGALTSNTATVSVTITPASENTPTLCGDGIDNDYDNLTDLADPDCAAFVPVVTPPSNGGGGNGGGGSSGGNGGGGGGVIVSGPLSIGYVNTNNGGGFVLGTSTEALPAGCSAYLGGYLRMGAKNNPDEVKKLQNFLNQYINAKLPVTGVFGPMTFAAVKKFQLANWDKVLKPWTSFGLPTDHTATGYVYKTTKHTINVLMCAALSEPEPQLP